MKQDQWTEQLRDALAAYEAPAPADLWADIEQTLGRQAPPSAPAPRVAPRYVALRRWAAAAAVAGVVALGGGYLWLVEDGPTVNQTATRKVAGQMMAANETAPAIAAVNEAAPAVAAADKTAPAVTAVNDITPAVTAADETASAVTAVNETAPAATAVNETAPAVTAAAEPAASAKAVGKTAADGLPAAAARSTLPTSPSPRPLLPPASGGRLSVGLYAMNGFGSQRDANGVLMADAMVRRFDGAYAASEPQAARGSEPIYLSGYEERHHHHRPVGYGLTLSYRLTGRLSLTSGAVYTRLTSDFTQVMHHQQVQREQTLHYVGVPLAVDCRLWAWRGLRVYASAGATAYVNVASRVVTEGTTQPLGRDRLQWALGAALGAQYDVVPQAGLYVEPGVQWYADNKSHLQNYFKDKPLNVSLQVGLRLNLSRW